MEKMRRARINDSLNELKTLVLEAMKKDVSIRKFTLKNKSSFQYSYLLSFPTGVKVFQNGKGRYSGNDCEIPSLIEH